MSRGLGTRQREVLLALEGKDWVSVFGDLRWDLFTAGRENDWSRKWYTTPRPDRVATYRALKTIEARGLVERRTYRWIHKWGNPQNTRAPGVETEGGRRSSSRCDEWQQHLGRAYEQQVGDRGAHERGPEPGVAADGAEAGADLPRHEPSLRRVWSRAAGRRRGGHRQQRRDRDRERARVQADGRPEPIASTSRPPSAGPAKRSASGRISWSSEFAWANSSSAAVAARVHRRRD